MAEAPVVVVEKKRGWGCCGCGCLVFVILVLLFVAVAGGISYFGYKKAVALTSTTALDLPTHDGGQEEYDAAQKKISDFVGAVQQHQPASLQLNADELNTLIEHNPGYASSGAHSFVTLTGDQAEFQVSFPIGALKLGMLEDRFANGQTTFSLNFDSASHQLNLTLQDFRAGDDTIPAKFLPMLQGDLNPALNQQFQAEPTCKAILDSAKTIEIKDGVLDIETQ